MVTGEQRLDLLQASTYKVPWKGSLIQSVGYILSAIAPPFPVFVFAYFLSGFGIALQDAGCSGYIAAMNDSTRMGIMHAIYGRLLIFSPMHSPWSFTSLLYRFRHVRIATCIDTVCTSAPLVLSLSGIACNVVNKYRNVVDCLPI